MDIVSLFVPTAYAAEAGGAAAEVAAEPSMGPILLLFVMIALMYALIWRPQNKMKKEHQALVTGIAIGDEIVTTGGIVGKVIELDGVFMVLRIAESVEIRVQKSAVSSSLPKGSVKF